MASTQLGILSTHQGHYARALTALQPGLARARRLENPHSLAFHQRLVGDALHGLGNDEESREFYLAAIDVQSWERSTQYFLTLLGLIRLELKAGRSKQAAYWLAEYLDGRRARREMTRLREGLFEIARLAQLQGNAEFVAKYLGAASNEPGVARCRGHASLEREMVAATNNALGAVRFTALFMRGQSESLTKVVEAAIAYAVEVAGKFRDTPVAEPDSETSDVQLTSREMQVLQCLAEGMTDREIGDALYISHQTASTHVRNILRKLDAPSRSMAVVVAVRHGLVTLSQ